MELRIRETLSAVDCDTVLTSLEEHLATVSQMVDRHQGVVTAFGIGSSAFGYNDADIGLFEVQSEPSCTVVQGLVHYDEEAAEARNSGGRFEPTFDQRFSVVLDSLVANLGLERLEPRELQQDAQHNAPDLAEEVARYTALHIPAEDAVPELAPALDQLSLAKVGTRLEFPFAIAPKLVSVTATSKVPSTATRSSTARRYALPAAAALAIAAAGLLVHHAPAGHADQPNTQAVFRPAASAQIRTSAADKAAPAQSRIQPTSSARALVSDPSLHARPENNLNQWASDWITALRSRDPDAQASFYSDRVDHYRGHHEVTRDDIARDRTVALENRQHLWTIRLEGMTVQKQTSSEAALQLRTRVIEQTSDRGVAELRVVTDLHVRNVNGVWKIVGEDDHTAA